MPKAAHQLAVTCFVANAFNWCATVPFFEGTIAGYTDPSALIWLEAVSVAAGVLFFSMVPGSLRLTVAPGGGLELLGINEMELSDESIKSLKMEDHAVQHLRPPLGGLRVRGCRTTIRTVSGDVSQRLRQHPNAWASLGSFFGLSLRSPWFAPRWDWCSFTRGSCQ